MPLDDDGDLIRGLGYVALHAAYLEEAVDNCIDVMLADDHSRGEKLLRQPTSRKIEHLQQIISSFEPLPEELEEFPQTLSDVSELLEERNLVIHGRHYNLPNEGVVRRPGRRNMPERAASSSELYELQTSYLLPVIH